MQFNVTSSLRLLLLSIFLLCSAALCQTTYGQRPSDPTASRETSDVLRVSTELVQTDVMVFDRQGRFVDGLKPDQFELRVDGKSVPISFFERVVNKRTGERVTAAERNLSSASTSAGRKIIFFLDDIHLAADRLEGVRKALLQFIESEMRESDEVAIASASGQIGFLQQFTDNKAVLRAAVARLKHRPSGIQDTGKPAMTEYVAMRIAQGDREALTYYVNEMLRSLQFTYALPKYGGKGGGYMAGSESDQAERMVMQRAQTILTQSAANSTSTLRSLENFLRTSSQTAGRKIILLISDGFFTPGNSGDAQKLQRITDAAARSGSVIYALDARAFGAERQGANVKLDSLGRVDKFSGGESEAARVAMTRLAEDTGGKALVDSGSFTQSVNQALDETFNYYLLAWRPETEAQKIERFRHVEVSVVGRPDLSVRTSRGFLESENDSRQKTSPGQIAGAKSTATVLQANAGALPIKQGLPTWLSVNFLDTPDSGTVLAVSTQVTTDALAYGENGKQAAAIDLAGVILNEHGNSASSFGTRLNVAPLSADGTGEESSGVIYNFRAPLAPGIYQVRVAARDDRTGRVGRAARWIEIPGLASRQMVLSSLFLGGEEIRADDKAASGKAQTTPQMQFSVDHRFRQSSRLNFFLFVYNAATAASNTPLSLTAEMRVKRDGRIVLQIPQQNVPIEKGTDLRRIPYGGSFALKALPIGSYTLEVIITNRSAQASASQTVKFEIE